MGPRVLPAAGGSVTAGLKPGTAEQRAPWAWLVGLTLLALALRVVALEQQLWYDEMLLAVRWAPLSLGEIVTTYTSQNQHMLYSVLARIAVDLFGMSNWALRLPAVLFGVATVPALYFCAREMNTNRRGRQDAGGTRAQQAAPVQSGGKPPHSRTEGLLAAALLAVSYHHVWFSQNARGYTGLAFWTVLTTFLFLRGTREGGLRPWTWYGVTMALGMYTHLTMGFVAAGQFVVYAWMLAAREQARAQESGGKPPHSKAAPLVGFVLAGVLTLALYAPVLPQVLGRTVGQPNAAATSVQSEWTNPIWLVMETLRGLAAGAGDFGYVALPAAAVLLLVGLASYWKQDRYLVGLMVAPGILTAVVMLVLEHNLWPRFFFFAIGFGMMLLVRGAMALGAWREKQRGGDGYLDREYGRRFGHSLGGVILALLMIAASALTLRSAWIYPKQDFAGALQFVDAQRQAGEPVALAGLAVFPYREYYKRDWPAVSMRAELDAVRARGERTWLVYASPIFVRSRQPEIWNAIATEFEQVRVFRGTMGDGAVYVCRSLEPKTELEPQMNTDRHR